MPLKVAWGGGLTNYSSHDSNMVLIEQYTPYSPSNGRFNKTYGETVSPRLYVGPLPCKTQRRSIFEAQGGCQSSHSAIFHCPKPVGLKVVELHPQELEEHTRVSYILQSEELGVRLHSLTFCIHLSRSPNLCVRERYHLPRLLPPRWANVRP